MRSTPSLEASAPHCCLHPHLADPRLISFGGRLAALVVERVAEERVRRALAEIKQPAPDPDSGEQLDIVDKTQAPMGGRSPSKKRRDRQEQLIDQLRLDK